MPKIAGDTFRLFIGVPVDERSQQRLSELLPSRIPGRPVPPAKWHFTLRFLGSTETRLIPRLTDSLAAASLRRAFSVQLSGLGAFPNPRRARVTWVGVSKGKAELELLASNVDSAVTDAGFSGEERPFKAHLTLSRIQPPLNVTSFVDAGLSVPVIVPVNEVILFRSHTGSGSSVYDPIALFPLETGK